jgi:hypothetical protein
MALDDPRQAVTLLKQAVALADTIGDIAPAAEARSGLARAQLQLGDPAAALATATARKESAYPVEELKIQLLEGLALLELHRSNEAERTFTGALTVADALLSLADSNVAALHARALALAGLAAATSDPARTSEAAQAFSHVRTITDAKGVAAGTQRLLEMITAHDQSGVLTGLSGALNLP